MSQILMSIEVTPEVIRSLNECGFALSTNGNAIVAIPNTNANIADVLRLARTSPEYKPNSQEVNHGYVQNSYGK